ncbi:MAG: hypothetical protein HY922_03540 [Elusimicrobia bacterium]|nr:hypothetical protein [Elusimicrobiota bacterium]
MDTVRIRMDPDFFPLISGMKLIYNHTSTEFEGVEVVELLFQDVRAFRTDGMARVQMTRTRKGQSKVENYNVRKTAKEVITENGPIGWGRKEYPIPAVPGKEWIEDPDRHVVASLEEAVQVPAGKFQRCLRVNTFIAGGDGGSAIRYYAPGVGYVYEEYSSETSGSRVSLTQFQMPKFVRL